MYISTLKCKYGITQYFSVTLVHYSNQYLLIRLCISQNNSDKQHHTIDYLQKPVTYSKSSVHCSQTSDVDAPVDRPKIGTGRFLLIMRDRQPDVFCLFCSVDFSESARSFANMSLVWKTFGRSTTNTEKQIPRSEQALV